MQPTEVISTLGKIWEEKEQMEENMRVAFPLADEAGGQSYSDISLILCTYLDVSAAYVRRYYNGNPPDIPPVRDNWAAILIRHQILLSWCHNKCSDRKVFKISGNQVCFIFFSS